MLPNRNGLYNEVKHSSSDGTKKVNRNVTFSREFFIPAGLKIKY